MKRIDRRSLRQRGLIMASVGYAFALCGALALKLLGLSAVGFRDLGIAAAATLALQGILWVVVQRRWETRLRWDPHFLYLPLLATAIILNLYAYVAPEARGLFLTAWFVALLFLAGFGGFLDAFLLTAVMAVGYFGVVGVHALQGAPISLEFEAAVAAFTVLISAHAGLLLARLRRERLEMNALRRDLAELAITDALTSLPNRRRFEEILRAELDRMRRYGGCCTVAMIDLDNFKRYNDALGHLAGDAILRELAALMRGHLRLSDILARYGGDEFGLIMVQAPKGEAHHAIDRLRGIVERYPFRDAQVQPTGRLTISAGVAACPDDGQEFEELVKAADDALYSAKRLGRNQVFSAADVA